MIHTNLGKKTVRVVLCQKRSTILRVWARARFGTSFSLSLWGENIQIILFNGMIKIVTWFTGLLDTIPNPTSIKLTVRNIWRKEKMTLIKLPHSLTPSRPDAARQFKWMFTGNQPIQTVTLIFSLTTPCATKDQWLTRYSFGRKTFPPRVKENTRKRDE